jgi:hypothetical protein
MPDRELHLEEDTRTALSSSSHETLIMRGLITAIAGEVKKTPNDQELGKKIRNLFNGKI